MGVFGSMHFIRFTLRPVRGWQPAAITVLCVSLALAAMAGAIVAPEKACAQYTEGLSAIYGRGVHAYFAGNSDRAEQLLTQVIQAGSTDPRAYYFRAIARQQMGRQQAAEDDMRRGAAYEARNPGSMGSISKALERVQGYGRRKLETFRRQARLNRAVQRRHQSHARYEKLQQRETQVLRKKADVSLEQLLHPPTDVTVLGEGAAESAAPAATPPSDSTSSAIAASDKVEPSKLFGILGRVISRTMPWNNVQLPTLGPAEIPTGKAPVDAFELGPIDEAKIEDPSSEDTIPPDDENLFSDFPTEPAQDEQAPPVEGLEDDPFEFVEPSPESGAAEEPATKEPGEAEEAEEKFDEDNPFGDF